MRTKRAGGGELVGIQYLRALAALMVVVFHLDLQVPAFGVTPSLPVGLAGGVDIFFVISGAIMWITTDGRPQTPGRFMFRRIVRVVPLYWAVTLFTAAVALIAPGLLRTSRLDDVHLIASLLFVPWPNPTVPGLYPLVVPGWTLNYEMAFYLLFALALPLSGRGRALAVAAALLAAVALGRMVDTAPLSALAFYTAPLVLEFGCGVLLGWMWTRTGWLARIAPPVAALLVVAGLATMLILPEAVGGRFLYWGLPATAIMTGTLALEARERLPRWRLPLLLGTVSYSLYLTHPIVLSAATRAWQVTGWTGMAGLLFYGAVTLVACCGAAIATWRLVEVPTMWLMRRNPPVAARTNLVSGPLEPPS
ncbi:acyltransferase [Croceibacterium sp. TMG7-5b_MA50]|uniref:acyltransferase family protein n=1 Tax=Croceibacterium sp. TMG7-5b_MA50 TaxID=3121290 RepID=UPI003221856B